MQNNKKSAWIRFFVCLGVLVILLPISFLTKIFDINDIGNVKFDLAVLLRLIMMIAGVIAVETVVTILLGLLHPQSHRARSVLSIVSSLLKYVAGIIILCWGLTIIGVNVSTIVASVGIITLVVGFSAESLISDVVTGAFMLFENQYNVGDIVEIGGFRGTVTAIGIRTTSITDVGGNVKIVNNSDMRNILNRSDKTSKSVCDFSIPYATDIIALEEKIPALLDRVYEAHTDMMKSTPKYHGVQALSESSVVLRFTVEVEEKDIYSGARVLNHDLFVGFRELGVEVPFPQIDVHNK